MTTMLFEEHQVTKYAPTRSPNGGDVEKRRSLHERFQDRLVVAPHLTRQLISYQGNRKVPGFRWLKYKEAFSLDLVKQYLDDESPSSVLDPFAGIGTAPLAAAGRGLKATGIEIMPVGVLAGNAIATAANGLSQEGFKAASRSLLKHVASREKSDPKHEFRHVRITESAFPADTEEGLAKAGQYISDVDDPDIRVMLNLACMSVLESVSYTRKDGQYLRWDYRSGRRLRSRVHKGPILPFLDALRARIAEMDADIEPLKKRHGEGIPELITGSSLDRLRALPDDSFDLVITSPPYANRYDYTRTYALELAWLGYDQRAFSALRQDMLSATVENRPKSGTLKDVYGGSIEFDKANRLYEEQDAIHEVLGILTDRSAELSNRHVIRLIEGYFLEMAFIITELARLVRPGGTVIMVNDNVQYHGEEVPVDLILSDYAERSGFRCTHIWTLPRGKGNSSQQMGRFGRRELRKCVYRWVRENG